MHVYVSDVRERAPPVTPNFGCARRNGKRPTKYVTVTVREVVTILEDTLARATICREKTTALRR